MIRPPGPLAWGAFAAAFLYAWIYITPLGAGMFIVVALNAATLFLRQRTGLFPFLFVTTLCMVAVGKYHSSVDRRLFVRPMEGIDFVAMALLIAAALLSSEEGLRRFGYRVAPARTFRITRPAETGVGWRELALLWALAVLVVMALTLFVSSTERYVRLGMYAWILGGAVFLAGMIRGFVALRAGGAVRARMLLLDVGWRQLRGPLRLFLRVGGLKRSE